LKDLSFYSSDISAMQRLRSAFKLPRWRFPRAFGDGRALYNLDFIVNNELDTSLRSLDLFSLLQSFFMETTWHVTARRWMVLGYVPGHPLFRTTFDIERTAKKYPFMYFLGHLGDFAFDIASRQNITYDTWIHDRLLTIHEEKNSETPSLDFYVLDKIILCEKASTNRTH
jgi:hypothetical protein